MDSSNGRIDVSGVLKITDLATNSLSGKPLFSVTVYFLKNKSQVFEAFKSFKTKAERQTRKKLKILRTYNGKAYVNVYFRRVSSIKQRVLIRLRRTGQLSE